MFGAKSEDELVAYAPWELSPEKQPDGRDSAEKGREILHVAMQAGSHFFEWTHRRIGGQEFFADVLLTRMGQGEKVIFQSTIRDITERKRAEELNARLAMAVEQASETIVITDTQGTILYANPAFERTTGYTRAEALGQNPRILKSGRQDDGFYRQMWEILSRGETWHGNFINRRKDGTFFDEEATISPVRDAKGRITNFVAVKRDVTREAELEAQFRQLQKMDDIGQLAGGVAHDFNNILAAMIMQTELGASVENLSEETRACFREIRAYSERAANLTRQLLQFSRRDVMQTRDVDLNEVVTSLAKMLQRIIGEDVRLQLHLHPGLPTTRADAGMMEQVLINLAANARDAMPKGGRLLIETAEKIVDENAAQRNPDAAPGRYASVIVSDTGSGIPPEILPRIFEPFFTTKETGKGTGLGLATVFGIVKQHRGWIMAESKPGEGASFQICLPASAGTAAAQAQSPAPAKPRGGTETILLVEDEEAVRALAGVILKRHGYTVLEAPNGREALKLWREHRADVALLVTDLVMPGGVSGQELARQLQAEQPRLKVVFTTGYSAQIAGRELALRDGVNFLQKPFTPDQLLGTIRHCLGG
jgi:PAS domain S-box-containing protein